MLRYAMLRIPHAAFHYAADAASDADDDTLLMLMLMLIYI